MKRGLGVLAGCEDTELGLGMEMREEKARLREEGSASDG